MISAMPFNGILGCSERVWGGGLGVTVEKRIAVAARLDLVCLNVDLQKMV